MLSEIGRTIYHTQYLDHSLYLVEATKVRLDGRQHGKSYLLGGEFAFVVFNEAERVKLLNHADHDRLVAIVGLSMALTPLLMIGLKHLLQAHAPSATPAPAADDPLAAFGGGNEPRAEFTPLAMTRVEAWQQEKAKSAA